MWPILHKDLRLELRTKEAISALIVLVILVLLVFTFALDPAGAAAAAPAVLWVTLIFSGLLAVQRAFLIERENGSWYGLLLCPIDRGAIFAAKMAANVVVLACAQVVLTLLLALFLGFSKRRHEVVLLHDGAAEHRASLREYSPYFLDQMISVVTASTVVAYAIYTVSPEVREKLHTDSLYLTVPFVLYGIFRYLYLVHRREGGGNPLDQPPRS